MNKRRRIYEGKAKVLYEGPEPGTLIQHFKDDADFFAVPEGHAHAPAHVARNRIGCEVIEAARQRHIECNAYDRRTHLKNYLLRSAWFHIFARSIEITAKVLQ